MARKNYSLLNELMQAKPGAVEIRNDKEERRYMKALLGRATKLANQSMRREREAGVKSNAQAILLRSLGLQDNEYVKAPHINEYHKIKSYIEAMQGYFEGNYGVRGAKKETKIFNERIANYIGYDPDFTNAEMRDYWKIYDEYRKEIESSSVGSPEIQKMLAELFNSDLSKSEIRTVFADKLRTLNDASRIEPSTERPANIRWEEE